jgi:hypothetical protein
LENCRTLNYPFDVRVFTVFFLKNKDDRNIKKKLIFFNVKIYLVSICGKLGDEPFYGKVQ